MSWPGLFRSRHSLWLLSVWAAAMALLSWVSLDGWHAHDDGVLAQSALRLLQGELPHRDFDAVYTGGLELLHAIAFRVFGVNLVSLRLVLLLAMALFIPVVYWIAARALSPLASALVTGLVVAWSVPAYFASLPSWYVTFLGVGAAAALLRYGDSRRKGWLFIAGVLAAASALMKVTGVFVITAGFLAWMHLETRAAPQANGRGGVIRWRGLFAITGVAVTVGIALLVRAHPDPMTLLCLVLPIALASAGLVRATRAPLHPLAVWPYLLGVAVPIVLWLIPYLRSGAVRAVWEGVFVKPGQRVTSAYFPMPALYTLAGVIPAALLLLLPAPGTKTRSLTALLVVAAPLAAVAAQGANSTVYFWVWAGLRPLVPLLALAALLTVSENLRGSDALVLALFAALIALQQYPFSHGIYFCYVAPAVILALAHLAALRPPIFQAAWGGVGAFALIFGIAWIDTARMQTQGVEYVRKPAMALLQLPRGGVDVPEEHALWYPALVELIHQHASPAAPIWVSTDAPEVYFLSERRNPTRTFYDVFDSDFGDPPHRRERILSLLDEQHVPLVVLASGEFSGPVEPSLVEALRNRFPEAAQIGRFTIRWRR